MPKVRDAARTVARAVSVALLCTVVVGCAVWASGSWADAARRQVLVEQEDMLQYAPPPEVPDPGFPRGPQEVAQRLPGPDTSGDITVLVHRDGTGEDWRVTTRYRLRLRADDPLVETLRTDPNLINEVLYVVPGGFVSGRAAGILDAADASDDNLAGLPEWCTVSQPADGGRITVTAERTVTTGASQIDFPLAEPVSDGDEGLSLIHI